MQDDAPTPTAYIICDWLHFHFITTMMRLPYSPDFNPIEKLWPVIKSEKYRLFPDLLDAPSTIAALEYLVTCAQTT
jgi:hypothetical protein